METALVAGAGGAFICPECVDRLFHEQRVQQAQAWAIPPSVPGRFDRFTERARKVLALANEEAQRFNHNYIGTEHLLLGMVREGEGIAAGVLESLGVNLEKVRSEVVNVLTGLEPPPES